MSAGDVTTLQRLADAFGNGRALVTGGAGFLGAHVCRSLLHAGVSVVAMDSFITGRRRNVEPLLSHPAFTLIEADVVHHIDIDGDVDVVLHLASPASPVDYLRHPIHTLKVGSIGTLNALGVARAKLARFLLASTSEVYGDPELHPQPETYYGNVDAIGPRGVYDEAKRFAEAMTYAYLRDHGVDVRVARIFNTYGPGMRHDDGRLIPTLVGQALAGQPLSVHGDGSQTRSLCYVDELVDGLLRLLVSDRQLPCNLGSDTEITVIEVAQLVAEIVSATTGRGVTIEQAPRPTADPQRRRPDLTVARETLGWTPVIGLREGLQRTIDWAQADPQLGTVTPGSGPGPSSTAQGGFTEGS